MVMNAVMSLNVHEGMKTMFTLVICLIQKVGRWYRTFGGMYTYES